MAAYNDLDDDLDMLDSRLTAASNPAGFGGDDYAQQGRPASPLMRQRPQQQAQQPAVAPPPPPASSELPRGMISDLRSWSSKWRFTPELEYIKIQRTHPAIYKAVNATGWLCDAYVPIDEEYLSTVWGGGMYVISVYQNNGGGSPREAARGYVQISGNPKAYRGQDGQPVPFPVDMNEGKYNGLPGVAAPQTIQPNQQQYAQQQYAHPGAPLPFPGHFQPPPQQQNSGGAQPTIDLISLAEKFSGTRQDSKSLEVLRDAQNANAEFYRSALDKSADEQRQLREQLMMLQQGQTAPLQSALETYRNQMESRDRAHNENVKRMVEEHAAQLNALRSQQEKTLEMMRLQSEKSMEEQRRASDSAAQRLADDARNREQTVRDSWRVETESLRREVDRIRDESRREQTELRESTRRELDAVREHAKIELQNARETSQRELQSLRETSQRDLQHTRETAQRDVDTLKNEADRRENNARENARGMFEGQIRLLETQLSSLKEQLEQRVSDVKSMHEQQNSAVQNNYTLQLQQRDSEINRYRDELQAARAEVSQLRNDVQEKSNPMKTLSEVAALTQTFQEITGTGKDNSAPIIMPEPAKEEEPKTLLAQLAKYAPVIGEHIVKPTMKPISEVVQTVREREAREEQLRRDIVLRRQAMSGGQNAAAQQQMAMAQQQQMEMAQQQQYALAVAQQQQQQQQLMQQRALQRQQELRARAGGRPPAPPVGFKVKNNNPQKTAPTFEFDGGETEEERDEPEDNGTENENNTPVTKTASGISEVDVGIPIEKDLIDYLTNAMSEGMSPAALAGSLNMGVAFGVVSSETHQKLKTLPTSAVVNAIAASAEKFGANTLASPRGMDYLESVHKAILAG